MHWRRKWQPTPVFLPGDFSYTSFHNLREQMVFPGGRVDENLPADAEDTGLVAGPGRFHFLQGN